MACNPCGYPTGVVTALTSTTREGTVEGNDDEEEHEVDEDEDEESYVAASPRCDWCSHRIVTGTRIILCLWSRQEELFFPLGSYLNGRIILQVVCSHKRLNETDKNEKYAKRWQHSSWTQHTAPVDAQPFRGFRKDLIICRGRVGCILPACRLHIQKVLVATVCWVDTQDCSSGFGRSASKGTHRKDWEMIMDLLLLKETAAPANVEIMARARFAFLDSLDLCASPGRLSRVSWEFRQPER